MEGTGCLVLPLQSWVETSRRVPKCNGERAGELRKDPEWARCSQRLLPTWKDQEQTCRQSVSGDKMGATKHGKRKSSRYKGKGK